MVYKRIKYPDGFCYAEISNFSDRIITERINSYEDLFFIKSLKDILDYNGYNDVELFIPWLPQQQHDRRFEENQSFELKLIADFINSLNFKRVSIFHAHSDVSQGVINNCRIIDNSSFIKKVFENILI